MTNIRELKAKPKRVRNKVLADMVQSAREGLAIDADIENAVMLIRQKDGTMHIIYQNVVIPTDPIAFIGCLEIAKIRVLDALSVDIDYDDDLED